jgi:hypothetical protein
MNTVSWASGLCRHPAKVLFAEMRAVGSNPTLTTRNTRKPNYRGRLGRRGSTGQVHHKSTEAEHDRQGKVKCPEL